MGSPYFKGKFGSCGSFVFCADEPPAIAQSFPYHLPEWVARNEGKGSGGCQWPLHHGPYAGVRAAVAGMALEALESLHFCLMHLRQGLPAPHLVKKSGMFSGTRENVASLAVFFYDEVFFLQNHFPFHRITESGFCFVHIS